MIFTTRDTEIVLALAQRVRVFTLEQISFQWWPGSRFAQATARRRLDQLVRADWLGCRRVPARPLLSLSQPVCTWSPGAAVPDHQSVSWKLQRRWTQAARQSVVYFASRRAAERFGGAARGGIKNLNQVTHDLHVSILYLQLLNRAPELASCWVGEDELAPERHKSKLPDAVLRNNRGQVFRAIEFGGSYSARRVMAFHNDCADRGLSYELY